MKTVKEVSRLTGVSVRTLHYYDEIGLLKPTRLSETGYRLYDDKAMEGLRQILFFREFDLPLKDIRAIMANPDLDRGQLLSGQKKMLVLKKERLERLIASIDDLLKGEKNMDFEVFSKAEIEQMYNAITGGMTEGQKEALIGQYGSMEEFEQAFMEGASKDEAQKNFAKVLEWYGDRESAMAAVDPEHDQIAQAYSRRCDAVLSKLADKVGSDVHTFEVREIVGELDFVCKQLYQMKDMSVFMTDMAEKYQNDRDLQERLDGVYGKGSTVYIGQALAAFYMKK